MHLPDVDENCSLYNFLHAVAGIAPEFANIWTISIQKKENSGKPLPDLHKIVELFRNNLRMVNARKGIPQSGFSSSDSDAKVVFAEFTVEAVGSSGSTRLGRLSFLIEGSTYPHIPAACARV